MSSQSTLTLSEALTSLAFDDKVSASLLQVALEQQRWGCPIDVALARLDAALHTLCDAAYRGDVALWGRTGTSSTEGALNQNVLRRVTTGECLENRLFVPSYDILRKGQNEDRDYEDAFAALASVEGLDDVQVDVVDLSRLKTTHGAIGAARFSDAEIDAWIGSTRHTGMKTARNAFMEQLRAKGLSATFESRWNIIKQNSVGRPSIR